jgi:transglutaminase-like putative cysteine protease
VILVALHHVTHYTYDRLVGLGPQQIRLRPAPHCRTKIASYSLKVTPAEHFVNWQQDPHGNWLARYVFPEKSDVFKIEVDLVAEMVVFNPFDFFTEPYAEAFPFAYPPELATELAAYLTPEPAGPLLAGYLANLPKDNARTTDFLVELNAKLQSDVKYLIRMEPGVQTPEETLALGSGSSRRASFPAISSN